MLAHSDFLSDVEFSKLIRREESVNLARVALELARDADPHLDFQPTLAWIRARAEELAGPVASAWSESDALRRLTDVLAERHGLHGDFDSCESPDASYLNRVIETRRGNAISLSILYMAVADTLHLEFDGVAVPLHFLTQYESAEGPLFIDAFHKGRVMNLDECLGWLAELTELPRSEIFPYLKPARPRTIVIRLLRNLKGLLVRDEKWPEAFRVQSRLVALQPGSFEERRDLGILALKAKGPAQGVELLRNCLKVSPKSEAALISSHLRDAESQLARWN